MIAITPEKTFTVSCSRNKMTKRHTYQKNFHIGTVLTRTLALFYKVFLLMIKKSLILSLSKIQNIFFIVLTISLKRMEIQDTVGLQKLEQKNKQFLLEKIIHGIEFENLYATDSKRKPEIMSTIEGNYRIVRTVYQQLYLDSAELFADFIRSFSIFEQGNMDEDVRANGWGIEKISKSVILKKC